MGMPFTARPAKLAPGTSSQRVEWVAEPEPEFVTISISSECLQRLLAKRELFVENFSCVDQGSRKRVHRLLLNLARSMSESR